MKENSRSIVNAFTVDVEDYFHTEAMSTVVAQDDWEYMPSHVDENTQRLLALLDLHGVCATFFVLGWTALRYPGLVRDIVAQGHEIGCHTLLHRPVFSMTPRIFFERTLRAKNVIEDTAGVRVDGYRAASFSMTPGTEWAIETLARLGFTYDSSVNPVAHPFYDNSNAPRGPHVLQSGIWEFPIATLHMAGANIPIGGGAYFRVLPYCALRWGWERLNRREEKRGIFYIHPWEVDPRQPRLRASRITRIRQYTNLAETERKLDRLLRDFRFGAIRDVFHSELSSSVEAVLTRAAVTGR